MLRQTLTFVLILFILTGCSAPKIKDYDAIVTVYTDEQKVKVYSEVASSEAVRMQGLMFREELKIDRGMFFMWDEEAPRTFWMKNTLIPIDMIFISKDFEVVDILNAVPCEEDPCKRYPSGKPAQYVLEVNSEFSSKYGVKNGSRIEVDFK